LSHDASVYLRVAMSAHSFPLLHDLVQLIFENSDDVFLAEDVKVLAINLHFHPSVLGQDNHVSLLQVGGDQLPLAGLRSGTNRQHGALILLLLRTLGKQNASNTVYGLHPLNQHSVSQRNEALRRVHAGGD